MPADGSLGRSSRRLGGRWKKALWEVRDSDLLPSSPDAQGPGSQDAWCPLGAQPAAPTTTHLRTSSSCGHVGTSCVDAVHRTGRTPGFLCLHRADRRDTGHPAPRDQNRAAPRSRPDGQSPNHIKAKALSSKPRCLLFLGTPEQMGTLGLPSACVHCPTSTGSFLRAPAGPFWVFVKTALNLFPT